MKTGLELEYLKKKERKPAFNLRIDYRFQWNYGVLHTFEIKPFRTVHYQLFSLANNFLLSTPFTMVWYYAVEKCYKESCPASPWIVKPPNERSRERAVSVFAHVATRNHIETFPNVLQLRTKLPYKENLSQGHGGAFPPRITSQPICECIRIYKAWGHGMRVNTRTTNVM